MQPNFYRKMHTRLWKTLAKNGLPHIATLSTDLPRYSSCSPLWITLQDEISRFKSKNLSMNWDANRNVLHVSIDDDKEDWI